LKILHVGKYFSPFSGGLENYMRDAMAALARRGVDSVALVHRHVFSLRTRDEIITAGGHRFRVIQTGMWARFLFTPISPAFPWHLRHVIKTAKPDILHLHMPNPSVFWALVLPSARRIPWIVHWHADVITSAQGWGMKLFYKLYQPFETAVLKRARTIVATSVPYRDSSRPLKKWLFKCHVVPLGVDTERYANIANDSAASPTTQVLQVLAVGRLTYYKGFRYLVEAAAQVPNVHINLVGLGEQSEQLKALVASLKLQDKVTFHGALSDPELARQMAQCDCLCLPSIERTEAFGMVLLEAMFFGKATIIGDVEGSGMGWVVDDGITGLKVKPKDADALAGAIERLANNRAELARMGQRGKEKFDAQFEINHAIAPLVDIYQQTSTDSK
jgi:glycosyltransferase involved in cell wall biosynthesis